MGFGKGAVSSSINRGGEIGLKSIGLGGRLKLSGKGVEPRDCGGDRKPTLTGGE